MNNKSSFQFKGYKIDKSIFEFENFQDLEDGIIGFVVKGTVKNSDNLFVLDLGIHISNPEQTSNIFVESKADYEFTDDLKVSTTDDLSDLFYMNSIALLFPHIRAYITALSSLSGYKPFVLPTLNVTSLKDDLKNNIEIVD